MEVIVMTYAEQSKKICDKIDYEIKKVKSMPKAKAKQYALSKLVEIGIYNSDGTLTKLYGGKK